MSPQTEKITDEYLMAYVDGQLSMEDTRSLESMLQENPVLKARLEPFKLTGAALMAGVFDRPMREEVPQRLLDTIALAPRKQARPTPDRPSGFLHLLQGLLYLGEPRFSGAFVATVLVLLGGAAGWSIAQRRDLPGAQVGMVATGDLASALEYQPSQPVPRPGTATPLFTFASRNSVGVCREYKVETPHEGWFAGVACRENKDQWRVAAHVPVPAPHAQKDGTFAPAEGEEQATIDAAIAALTKGDAMAPEEERAWQAHSWSQPGR